MSLLKSSNNLSSKRILEINRGKNGYGFVLSGQAPCYVSWIIRGSPAEQIGLIVGDCIISVNGTDVSEASHEDVVKLIGISSGMLLLGVAKPYDKSHDSAEKDQSSISRTEKVLQDLHSGVMFESVSNFQDANVSTKPASPLVLMRSVVAYLGTVEIEKLDDTSIEESSFSAVQQCVDALRLEQHIHQRVVMIVTQSCVKLLNADRGVVAVYQVENLRHSDVYTHDSRFFYIVTSQPPPHVGDAFMVHVFLIDPNIARHSAHIDKAKRFSISCSTGDDGQCAEFPSSPDNLLSVIRLLHSKARDNPLISIRPPDDQNEPCNNSNNAAYHVVDLNNQSHSSLTRGESSLPPSMRISWSDTLRKTNQRSGPNRGSPHHHTTDSSDTHDEDMKNEDTNSSGKAPARSSSTSSVPSPMRKAATLAKVRSLNREELCREFPITLAHIPPPMQKLSLEKYSLASKRGSSASLGRSTARRKKLSSRSTHGKRQGRLFPSHITSSVVCRSSENVAAYDGDILSGASSMESLASNVSLPSCINGSLAGNSPSQERPSHHNSQSGVEDGAGRISYWAVSFDRMLEDPLGVKYFKEFLRKEFSEENILFWEACEKLRRCDPSDETKMKLEILDIYNRFLSLDAEMGVNIDSQGQQLAEESLHSTPHPNIFMNQQQQVYTLMKLDSYSRFLKSSLYRQCMLSEMEGKPLPLDADSDLNDSESRNSSRSLDSDTLQRQTKKFKGSRKGLFSFKNRSKSQREKLSGNPLTRQSSGDSTGSDSAPPLQRTSSLPTSSFEMIDPCRVCHVTLWDNSSTVLYAKKAGGRTLGDALSALCERRGAHISSVDVYLIENPKKNGENHHKRSLSLNIDMSSLGSQSIVIERKALLRIDVTPAGKSVSVKARPSKTISDVLKPVLEKYNLKIEELRIKNGGDGKDVALSESVSTYDGRRVVAEMRPISDKKSSKSLKQEIPDKKDTEELIQLMASLHSSKMHDQRGLLSRSDLELPEFLKISPNNNNNNNIDKMDDDAPTAHGRDILLTSSDFNSPPKVTKSTRRMSKSGERRRQSFVELSSRPKTLTTFKPTNLPLLTTPPAPKSPSTPDDTVVEDATLLADDFDVTLVSIPSPSVPVKGFPADLPMPDYSPPTPLRRK